MNIKKPSDEHDFTNKKSIFLAGTTDKNVSGSWRDQITYQLSDLDINILNPELKSWFDSDKQTISNPLFKSQVDWELEGLEFSDVVLVCFLSSSKSPITLIEFGLMARTGKLVVYCEKDFWRYGNIEVVCHRYGIPMAKSFKELIFLAKEKLK